MRDVVIIGGGLTGLAAAHELERLNIPYRLIEVKKHLGGSIHTERVDNCVLDTGAFAFPQAADWSFLDELGLTDALIPVADGLRGNRVAFKNGTGMLIDTLASNLTGTMIHRMAVSSIGQLDGRFTLCMENGLVFDAGALIVTAPARHAERMFRTLQPEISLRLFGYTYDSIIRLSLVYRLDDLPDKPRLPWDVGVPFLCWTDDPHRVPAGHRLMHIGVRMPAHHAPPEAIIDHVHERLQARNRPVVARAGFWEDADPLPPHGKHFAEHKAALDALLPPGIALAGSDYAGLGLSTRYHAGRSAARKIAAWLAENKT